tara:strand:- start:158 stop:772 length:615 start_codon:yes stop_codon:yes gene_type:complete
MYNVDQKAISKLARNSIEFCTWLIVMVLVSIRTPWINIVKNMEKVKKDGANATILNNKSKNKGYRYIKSHAKQLHETIFNDYMTTEEKLVALCDIPNIALVKAGFILQLCLGEVGCIDCHNASKHGVDLGKLKVGSNATLATKLRKAKVYNDVCKKAGGSRKLWDTWCTDRYESSIKNASGNAFTSARHVSLQHLDAIVSVAKK